MFFQDGIFFIVVSCVKNNRVCFLLESEFIFGSCDSQRTYERLTSLSKHSPLFYFPTLQVELIRPIFFATLDFIIIFYEVDFFYTSQLPSFFATLDLIMIFYEIDFFYTSELRRTFVLYYDYPFF